MKKNIPDVVNDYEKREVSAHVMTQDATKITPKEEKLSSTIEQIMKQESSEDESTS